MQMRSNMQGLRWCAPPLTDSQLSLSENIVKAQRGDFGVLRAYNAQYECVENVLESQ